MSEYAFQLGEFSGSEYLELRKGSAHEGRKFLKQDSLYVLDNAFFFFLESIFKEVVAAFDMFEDTCITKNQWQEIMLLSIPDIVHPDFINEAEKTLVAINRWVEEKIGDGEEFIIIGV